MAPAVTRAPGAARSAVGRPRHQQSTALQHPRRADHPVLSMAFDQPPLPPPHVPAGWAPYITTPPPGPAAGLRYAGFWLRFAAWLVDAVLLSVLLALLSQSTDIGFKVYGGGEAVINDVYYQHYYGAHITNPIPVLIAGAYFIVCWSAFQRTFGGLLAGMRICRLDDGRPPGIGRALVRYIGLLLAAIPLGLGLMWAGWDPRKQGWHDKLAGTVVVRRA